MEQKDKQELTYREQIELLALCGEITDIGSGQYYIKYENKCNVLYDIITDTIVAYISDYEIHGGAIIITCINGDMMVMLRGTIVKMVSRSVILETGKDEHFLSIRYSATLPTLVTIPIRQVGLVVIDIESQSIIIDDLEYEEIDAPLREQIYTGPGCESVLTYIKKLDVSPQCEMLAQDQDFIEFLESYISNKFSMAVALQHDNNKLFIKGKDDTFYIIDRAFNPLLRLTPDEVIEIGKNSLGYLSDEWIVGQKEFHRYITLGMLDRFDVRGLRDRWAQ